MPEDERTHLRAEVVHSSRHRRGRGGFKIQARATSPQTREIRGPLPTPGSDEGDCSRQPGPGLPASEQTREAHSLFQGQVCPPHGDLVSTPHPEFHRNAISYTPKFLANT